MATKQPKLPIAIETLKHDEARRKNILTDEYQSVIAKDEQKSEFNKMVERVANGN